MKKIILISMIVISTNCFCQTTSQLDKFVGTWRWVSNNDTVSIVLEKQNVQIYPGYIKTLIVGWHKYVKNGILIQSSFQYIGRDKNLDLNSTATDLKTTLMGHLSSPNSIWCTTFWDLSLHKSFYLYLTLLPNSTTQLKWNLRQHNGIYSGPSGTFGLFTLPKSLIMAKL
jgi:hypothetical protein